MLKKLWIVPFLFVSLCGCNSGTVKKEVSDNTAQKMPVFSLATSEYPSWSTFVVAQKAGLIGKADGEPGSLEKKWGVRLKLEVKDYDPCLTMFGGGTVDAVCMTNIDALNPALGRPSTVIMPTSTSVGGDKVISSQLHIIQNRDNAAPGTNGQTTGSLRQNLANTKTYGLAKSVSEYVWYRGLEKMNLNPKDYQFVNLEPAAAATALQTGSKDVQVVCIWNPFALQTIRNQKSAIVLFDSSIIPEEVIDCVVIGDDSLKKEGADKFACLVCDVFYAVCQRMDNPKSSDITYKSLGEEFSNLSVDDMKIVCKETRFYATPQAGIKLFSSEDFQKTTMPLVVKTSQSLGILDSGKTPPTIGYNDSSKQLNFDTTYMQKVAATK